MTPERNEGNPTVTHLVRATHEPDVVREVSDGELIDLHRSGILEAYEHTDAAAAVLGGTVPTPGRWKAPAKNATVIKAATDITASPEPVATQEG